MESNNPLAGDGKRVLVRKKETSRYCKSSLRCVISVSDSSPHFVAEFLHCSVKNGLSLQPWDTHRDTHGYRLSLRSRGALLVGLCFLIQNCFLFHCIYLLNEVEEEPEKLILQSDCTDMYLKRFLGISKYNWNYFFRINL